MVADLIDLARGEVEGSESPERGRRENYKPRGVGFLAAGGAAVVVGVALIAIGVTRTKKKQRARAARVQIDASPSFAGLRVSGKF